jgi:RNA polymerase sigma-70 factor, ECF subfamily
MDEISPLATRFEDDRSRLLSLAYRFLGSAADADDAVQEAWIRLSTTDPEEIENLGAWLTTVVSRICLNMLRSRQRRQSDPLDEAGPDGQVLADAPATPEEQVVLADSLGPALLVILDMLSPAERIALVLHDVFAVPFDEVGAVLGKSGEARRQLASRARRRVRTADDPDADPQRQRQVVHAFLDAAKNGEFEELLSLLSPDVTLEAYGAAVAMGAPQLLSGPDAVAGRFSGGAHAARTALIDGTAGLVWAQGGRPKVVFDFTVLAGRVARIDMFADEEVLAEMEIRYERRRRGGAPA